VTLVLIVLCSTLLLTLTGAASAAIPSRPTANSPGGTVMTSTLTFTWSRALRAGSYDLRVYNGSQRVLNKRRLTKRTWTGSRFEGGWGWNYTWKVRGRNASGSGPWSRTRSFQVDPTLWDDWDYVLSNPDGSRLEFKRLIFFGGGTYEMFDWTSFTSLHGLVKQTGSWAVDTATTPYSMTLANRLESWQPADDDTSGILAYEDQPRSDVVWSFGLVDWNTLTISDENDVQWTFVRHTGITD
jgi:hypothetical protein